MIRETIKLIVSGKSLSMDEAAQAMDEIMSGEATEAQFGAFVTALRLKGETADEIAGMARVMRKKALRVEIDGPLLDIVGTGGDGSFSFNISTAAAIVVAGTGATVAKHGNRAMSSATGSADVLEALGVKVDLGPEGVERCLQEVGFGFMFAQRFHPLMRLIAGPRREIGIRTIFNILGPLTNPAGAQALLLGVSDASVAEKMAQVLGRLGTTHALIVHGQDGMDEISPAGATNVWELKDGSVTTYTVSPEDFQLGRNSIDSVRVSSVDESARIVRDILAGSSGPARDVVLMNAAAALLAADRVATFRDGVIAASEAIDSGKASRKLDALIKLSQSLK